MPARRERSSLVGGRRPKASEEGTRGRRRGVGRLWRFDGAAAVARTAVANLAAADDYGLVAAAVLDGLDLRTGP
jgi:hypothetical protein